MRKPRSTCLLALGVLFCSFTSSYGETLQEAVQEIINTNPDVRSVAYNRLARDQEVIQAESDYLPKVELQLGVGVDKVEEPFDEQLDSNLAQISLRQNIFNGLATMNEVDRQKARVRSEAFILRSTIENTALRTARVYIDVLKNKSIQELAKENLLIHERIADQIRLRSESGVGRKVDMDQIQSRLTLAHSNVILARQNILDAETNYMAVVGRIPKDLSQPEITESILPDSLEEAEQLAVARHPTLKSADADLEARRYQDETAKSPFYPSVDLELDQIWEHETDYSTEKRENLRALVRLRYNLFNGWNDQARKAETLHLVNEAREIRDNTHRQVIESTRLSWQAYQSALARIQYLEQRVQFATATASAYTKQWNIGQRTLLDVLDSEAERIESIQQLIVAKQEGLYAQFRVLNATGQLVTALAVQWPHEAVIENEPVPPAGTNS